MYSVHRIVSNDEYKVRIFFVMEKIFNTRELGEQGLLIYHTGGLVEQGLLTYPTKESVEQGLLI